MRSRSQISAQLIEQPFCSMGQPKSRSDQILAVGGVLPSPDGAVDPAKPSRDPESQLPFRFLASGFEKLAQLLCRLGTVADAVLHLLRHFGER